jgi:AcrR family transcriptional regulator
MPKPFNDSEKDHIRRQLLEQGYRLFSIYGLKKTNIDEIARAAGISKGAFYGFYDSKEALFLEVTEVVEQRVRREMLALIDQPGPSPRARLLAVLKKAFGLLDEIPFLKFATGSDLNLLFRRIPPEKLQEHLDQDRVFVDELFQRCQQAGILITAQPEEMLGLLYPLVLAVLHQDDPGAMAMHADIDLLLELVAAYCLGEVETAPRLEKGSAL